MTVPPHVIAAVRSTDRESQPCTCRPKGPAVTVPRPRTAPDDNANREWACSYLSRVLGREVRGGRFVDELTARLTDEQEARR